MSVVARDQSTAGHIIFPWPEPLPWGAELVCDEGEVAIICPNWQVGEQLGPGHHAVRPPDPQSYILAYFISTVPHELAFERTIQVLDRSTGQAVYVQYSGLVEVKIGDPMLLCHQLVGLPYYDLATGVMRSAKNSIEKAFQHVIGRVCLASASVAAIAKPRAVSQLVTMTENANPMAVAVTGVELVRVSEFSVSIAGGEPIVWRLPAPAAAPVSIEEQPEVQAAAPAEEPEEAAGKGTAAKKRGGQTTQKIGSFADTSTPRFPVGSTVLVYWTDGLWHMAVVRQADGARYQISLDGTDTVTWVAATQVRPAH